MKTNGPSKKFQTKPCKEGSIELDKKNISLETNSKFQKKIVSDKQRKYSNIPFHWFLAERQERCVYDNYDVSSCLDSSTLNGTRLSNSEGWTRTCLKEEHQSGDMELTII